jgi:hypothetical protein
MFIMVDVLRKPDGNKPGMMPAVIARRKSFSEHDSDLVRLRMLLIMQNKIYARMFDSVAGFVFFAHGASFQNGVRLASPYFGGFRDSQQRTNLGTLGFFLGRFRCLLRHRMDLTSRTCSGALATMSGASSQRNSISSSISTPRKHSD